jgi:integrase
MILYHRNPSWRLERSLVSKNDRSIRRLSSGRWEVSKYWPDHTPERSSRFRRSYPTADQAKAMRARIENAIVSGTWKDLRRELVEAPPPDYTLREFSEIFMTEMRKQNRRSDFHYEELYRETDGILAVLGNIRLKEFRRQDAMHYKTIRNESVSGATVNRGLAVLSRMLTHAIECGLIENHPMTKFRRYKEEPAAVRAMTLDEERSFVAALLDIDEVVGLYAGVMGETALRPSEALRLTWDYVDLDCRQLAVTFTKGKRPRYIDLSPFCMELLGKCMRVEKYPNVFIRPDTFTPLKDARDAFRKAQKVTGLDWVHEGDFRDFRATQWVKDGVDLRVVKEALGHADIHTTMRYAHFDVKHAQRTIAEAWAQEEITLRTLMFAFRKKEAGRTEEILELEQLHALEPGKR